MLLDSFALEFMTRLQIAPLAMVMQPFRVQVPHSVINYHLQLRHLPVVQAIVSHLDSHLSSLNQLVLGRHPLIQFAFDQASVGPIDLNQLSEPPLRHLVTNS